MGRLERDNTNVFCLVKYRDSDLGRAYYPKLAGLAEKCGGRGIVGEDQKSFFQFPGGLTAGRFLADAVRENYVGSVNFCEISRAEIERMIES